MDEFDVEDMLEDLRVELHDEIARAIVVVAACLTNAINAQPNVDNVKFTTDLIAHLGDSSGTDALSGVTAGALKHALEHALAAGLSTDPT